MPRIESELREVAAVDGYICIAELKRYIKLNYRDLFDVEHNEYCYVAPIGGGSRISQVEGSRILDQFDQDPLSGISNSTAQDIWTRAITKLRSK
jgi:hypothetical protein